MANVSYIRPIESLHGKLGKHDQVSYSMRVKSFTKFTVTRDDWKQHYKTAEAETAARLRQQKFRSVSMAASERMQDPTKKTADQQAYKAQFHVPVPFRMGSVRGLTPSAI